MSCRRWMSACSSTLSQIHLLHRMWLYDICMRTSLYITELLTVHLQGLRTGPCLPVLLVIVITCAKVPGSNPIYTSRVFSLPSSLDWFWLKGFGGKIYFCTLHVLVQLVTHTKVYYIRRALIRVRQQSKIISDQSKLRRIALTSYCNELTRRSVVWPKTSESLYSPTTNTSLCTSSRTHRLSSGWSEYDMQCVRHSRLRNATRGRMVERLSNMLT